MSNKITSTDTNEIKLESGSKQDLNAKEIVLKNTTAESLPKEINGPKGLEPTRYGDWESKGRCYDF